MTDTTPVNLDDYANTLRHVERRLRRAASRLSEVRDPWAESMAEQIDELADDFFERHKAVCNGDIVQAESGG